MSHPSLSGADQEDAGIAVVNATRLDFDASLQWNNFGQYLKTFYDPVGVDPSDEDIVKRAEGCAVLVTKEIALSEHVIQRLPESIRLICEAGTGYNNISLSACRARGILVANVPAYSTVAVAHLVLTFMLTFSSSLVAQQRMLFGGDRSQFTQCLSLPHFELVGKTIGLVGGRGSIGAHVAQLALALGMHVIVSTRKRAMGEDIATPEGGIEYTSSVLDLLQRSDFVSLHCPLNEETRHLINISTLNVMKKTAFLINTARGGLIDEAALITALRSGTIAGAALDVQDPEPPLLDSPLYTLPNVIITPHIGWKRKETRQRLLDAVVDNIRSFVSGKPINIVS